MISVVVPCFNESKYIENMIDSVARQTIGTEAFEIIVVDGNSDDGTREILWDLQLKYPFMRVLNNPHKTAPYGLNIGIKQAKGEFIARMDVHAEYPPEYLEVLLDLSERTGAANVGCCIDTLPAETGGKEWAIAKSISTPFGVGNSYFRIGQRKERLVDTVPFGFFRREVFEKIGLFDTELTRCQDNEFNGRIRRSGMEIWLTPRIKVNYFAREKLCKLSRMFYQYGFFKPWVNQKLGAAMTVRQFIPPLFVLFLIAGFVFALFGDIWLKIYLSVIFIYFVMMLIVSTYIVIKERKSFSYRKILWLLMCFPILHLSYGSGYLLGIINLYRKDKSELQAVNITR